MGMKGLNILNRNMKKEKEVVCGHDEVCDGNGKEEKKVFVCGAHGEHKLADCQKLCV